jgi:epoxyqueuosine reductase
MGAWVFGCDVCQDVCPPTMERFLRGDERNEWAAGLRAVVQGERWLPGPVGHRVGESSSPLFDSGRRPSADLFWLARLSHEEYVEAFRGTSIKRAKVWMLRRNAVIALGNVADLTAVEVLVDVLVNDDSELVRGHAAWALGRLGARHQPGAVLPRLAEAARAEKSPYVLEEIHAAQATARSA